MRQARLKAVVSGEIDEPSEVDRVVEEIRDSGALEAAMDEANGLPLGRKHMSRPRRTPKFATCSSKLPTSSANGRPSANCRSYIATSPVSYIRPKILCQ